jgi:hypothetical protein
MKVLKYSEFIKESFMTYQDTGSNNTPAIDGSLSLNGFDRDKAKEMEMQIRLLSIISKVYNATDLWDSRPMNIDIKKVEIVKMLKNNNNDIDIFIKINSDDDIYYGKFENWLKDKKFTSSLLNNLNFKRMVYTGVRIL